MSAARIERWLVVLIALHSFAVGFMLLGPTAWSVGFAGWGGASPLFFPRQAGVFHFVVASAYLIEYFRYRGVVILVMTRAIAAVFLLAVTLLGEAAWSVPFSAVSDAVMGAAAFWAFRSRQQSERAVRGLSRNATGHMD